LKINFRKVGFFLLIIVASGSVGYFYYNYIQNTPGQARSLKLDGLIKEICGAADYKIERQDHCGARSIYSDADWGVTAYYEVYGVDSIEEARSIAAFIKFARASAGQSNIPINLKVYSLPRSQANRLNNHKILDQDI
jgi:hypothetical protein